MLSASKRAASCRLLHDAVSCLLPYSVCSLVLVLMVAKEPGALGIQAALRLAAGCFERADTCNRSSIGDWAASTQMQVAAQSYS